MENSILIIRDLQKSFPGVQALKGVTMDINRGEVHGLVGENGAGKSTLINILSGVHKPDSGTIIFEDSTYSPKDPLHAIGKGIAVVHQELKLAETLSVMENIFLGRPPSNKLGLVNWAEMKKKAKCLIDSLGIKLEPEQPVDTLSVAQKQIVEICKALSLKAKVVIMDEPSATLTAAEMKCLYSIIKKLKNDGVTVIYVSHRLEEIFDICDSVTVLRDGAKVSTSPVSELNRKELISLMVGRKLGMEYSKAKVPIGEVLLSVKNLSRPGVLFDINFDVHRGEIFGVSGLIGAGRTEMARALLAADKGIKANIKLRGEPYQLRNVHHAVKSGIGLVPEDRKGQGLVLGMSIRENISLVNMGNIQTLKLLNYKKEQRLAQKYISALRIAAPNDATAARSLSGGNQQKVVIAKWLNAECDVLIIDEPTRGIDVGAKQEIYKIICKLAAQNKAIIMISSEMPELLGLCDRIAVMREGRITGILDAAEATQESILNLAIV